MAEGDRPERIGLVALTKALHDELEQATEYARTQDIQFPISGVDLELQVGVTWEGGADAKVSFWVVEIGGSGKRSSDSIQTITLHLGPPKSPHRRPLPMAAAKRKTSAKKAKH